MKTHGMTGSPEYLAWVDMKQRCCNKKHNAYKNYGGCGIKAWKHYINSFENWDEDLGPRPSSKHSIDRINNDIGYFPGNVRWATRRQQQNNTRRNRMVLYKEKWMTLVRAIRKSGSKIKHETIRNRLNYGWNIKEALEVRV